MRRRAMTDDATATDDPDELMQWQHWRRRHQQLRAPAHVRAQLERAYRARHAARFVRWRLRWRWGMAAVAAAASTVLVIAVGLRAPRPGLVPAVSMPVAAHLQAKYTVDPFAARGAPSATSSELLQSTREPTRDSTRRTSMRSARLLASQSLPSAASAIPTVSSLTALPTAPSVPPAPSFGVPALPGFSSVHFPSLRALPSPPALPRVGTPNADGVAPPHVEAGRDTGSRIVWADDATTV